MAKTMNMAVRGAENAARKHALAMITRLYNIAMDDTAPVASQISAAQTLLDRGMGRPKNQTETKIEVSVTHQHLDAVRELSRVVDGVSVVEQDVEDAAVLEITDESKREPMSHESKEASKLAFAERKRAGK